HPPTSSFPTRRSSDLSRSKQIEVRALGFRTLIANIPDSLTNLVFELTHDSNKIEAVSISHKSKYRNRNNKAVELIDLVIRHKHQDRKSTRLNSSHVKI